MSKENISITLNLQLFAEGGSGDGATGNDGTSGVSVGASLPTTKGVKNSLADVRYGIQDVEESAPTEQTKTDVPRDRVAEFEAMIKGEYKDLYDARVSDTVQKRLKGSKETVDRFNALTPTLEILAKKYGVDASDINALNKAIEEDDSYFEDEALEKGVTVEQLKAIRKMERENADLKRQMREQTMKENADRVYSEWMSQSEALKSVYPGFNLEAELKNPQFTNLLRSNIDVRTAYEVLHKDEIIPAAMQFAAKKVEQKLASKIMANGNRPTENALNSQSSAIVKSDVAQLSKADRQEIIKRVAAGEKIRF